MAATCCKAALADCGGGGCGGPKSVAAAAAEDGEGAARDAGVFLAADLGVRVLKIEQDFMSKKISGYK